MHDKYLDDLRDRIHAHHDQSLQQALQAVDLISRYFAASPSAELLESTLDGAQKAPHAQNGGETSTRQLVAMAIGDTWKTVEQIAEITGVDAKKIRGALYSREWKKNRRLRKRKKGKVMTYHLKPNEEAE